MRIPQWLSLIAFSILLAPRWLAAAEPSLRGEIRDAATGELLAARLYIYHDKKVDSVKSPWYFAKSAATDGSAVAYRKQRGPRSVEMHTTLSAHPFVADLPPGKYTLTVERGKEYLPVVKQVEIGKAGDATPVDVVLRLKRWIEMSKRGWYSGETHVHRSLQELPNAMLADDLNVALPLTYWVTQAHVPPSQGNKNDASLKTTTNGAPQLIKVDDTHVIYPLNTEYEIFTVGGKRHTLGAVFALNHTSVLKRGAPPVKPIARQVKKEGGLLELDKHNWPWSMMLVPVMEVDLYELTNNHLWRTEFSFGKFGEAPPAYMRAEQDENGMTERGWLQFTLENYYALLNCGFRLRPTAGTASGVHPVPLGFGRVYVHLPDGFSYDAWMKALDQGRSFVTTGPMLTVATGGHPHGATVRPEAEEPQTYEIVGSVSSARPLAQIEVIAAGKVVRRIAPVNDPRPAGGYESPFKTSWTATDSTWLAVRCLEKRANDRVRFAHTAPVHIDVPDRPLRPRPEQVEYLIERLEKELERNRGVLSSDALAEYEEALNAYRKRK